MRQLTEAEAWQKIGEAFEAKHEHPELEIDPSGKADIASTGLCSATARLSMRGDIPYARERQMDWKTRQELNAQGVGGFLYPTPSAETGAIDRAALAYLFAAEAA